MVKILHAADFHLDSAFGALESERSRLRRRESRDLIVRMVNYAEQNGVQLILLSGDLFDGETVYRETIEQLGDALAQTSARVFIAPGNHDPYAAASPYTQIEWPENVHIFTSRKIERVALPDLGCAVYGAAFTQPRQSESLLRGFCATDDGLTQLMVLHGSVGAADTAYDPITIEQIAASGLDYLALGHIHRAGGVLHAGKTAYAYPGCPEGRGFDELGEKGFLCGSVERGKVELTFVPFARRRYEILHVDVSDRPAEAALRAALPAETARDIYRVVFTGEVGASGIDLDALRETFASDFFHLELRDETTMRQDVWARAGEDSLRGLFLRELRARWENAPEEERARVEQAVRFGLAALDGRDL